MNHKKAYGLGISFRLINFVTSLILVSISILYITLIPAYANAREVDIQYLSEKLEKIVGAKSTGDDNIEIFFFYRSAGFTPRFEKLELLNTKTVYKTNIYNPKCTPDYFIDEYKYEISEEELIELLQVFLNSNFVVEKFNGEKKGIPEETGGRIYSISINGQKLEKVFLEKTSDEIKKAIRQIDKVTNSEKYEEEYISEGLSEKLYMLQYRIDEIIRKRPNMAIIRSFEIHEAAEKGDLSMIKKLLTNNLAFIDIKDKNGETPLHKAIKGGFIELIRLLISMGANINAKANDGTTPLRLARKLDKKDITDFLQRHGAKE